MIKGLLSSGQTELSPNEERTRFYSCTGKRQYVDSGSAEKAAKTLKKAGKSRAVMGAYACDFCGFYHLGHAPGTKKDRKPRFR